MRIRRLCWAAMLTAAVATGQRADAAVNLVLQPHPSAVPAGSTVDIALLAVSDTGGNQSFSAMDVILIWDPKTLELTGATDNEAVPWALSGFQSDDQVDGINNTFLDGDAVYTVLSIAGAAATPTGLLVTTFHFKALAGSESTRVIIVPSRGRIAKTQVFAADKVNQVITGTLGEASVSVFYLASLAIADRTVPAGRPVDIVVWGEIIEEETFGVTVVVQLAPRSGATGAVSFTPAPPSDIFVINDPWPGVGTESVFDTDLTNSELGNGAVLDNGTFLDTPLTFSDELAGFPVAVAADARGTWDARLCVEPCGGGDPTSWWDAVPAPVPTALRHGTLTVVALGDGDGSGLIDLRDFADLQVCFTGAVGPVNPPAYPSTPQPPCAVYDFDEDGDVDGDDYASFQRAMPPGYSSEPAVNTNGRLLHERVLRKGGR